MALDDPLVHAGGSEDPLIGTMLAGRYKIVALLGQGGMGNVYEAIQAPFDRHVAIKLLRAGSERDPRFQKRFMLEASVTARLTHPNTITLLDYGSGAQGQLYIAMELLKGRPLSRAMHDEGPFTQERALQIARQVGRSLREAHALGIVHRDLKPANVFLLEQRDEPDFVKVLDFGLVKMFAGTGADDLTHQGVFMGTPQYVSPEQARNQSPDQRADVYSLGVLLFHMLTGRVPFAADNMVDVILKLVTEPPPALAEALPGIAVAPEMEALIRRCLEKRSEDRFVSMDELLLEMRRVGELIGARDSMPTLPPAARARDTGPGIARGMSTSLDFTALRTPMPRTNPELSVLPVPPIVSEPVGAPPGDFEVEIESELAEPGPPQVPATRSTPLPIAPLMQSQEPHALIAPVARSGIQLSAWIGGAIAVGALLALAWVSLRAAKSEPLAGAPVQASAFVAPPSSPGAPSDLPSPAVMVPPVAAGLSSPARNVPAFVLHKDAIAEPAIAFSAAFRSAHAGQHLAGMYEVCAGTDGRIASVAPVQSIPGADGEVAAAITTTWRYRAQPAPLCAVIPLSLDVR